MSAKCWSHKRSVLQLTLQHSAWGTTARLKLKRNWQGTRTSGGAHVWFNSKQREKKNLTSLDILWRHKRLCCSDLWLNADTGGAWLSSARVVRCWVKSQRHNLAYLVANGKMGTLDRLPVINWRKVGMTSNHHAPWLGLHTCYNG